MPVNSEVVQDPAIELSSLISRAKHLMGVIDHNKGGSVGGSEAGTTRLLQNNPAFSPTASAATKGPFHPNAGNLRTVVEHEVRLPMLITDNNCLMPLQLPIALLSLSTCSHEGAGSEALT